MNISLVKKWAKIAAIIIAIPAILFIGLVIYFTADNLYTGDLTMTTCKQIKDHPYPPINKDAIALYQEGNRLRKLYPQTDANMNQALALFQRAAKLGHWKASINQVSLMLAGHVSYHKGDADRLLNPLLELQVPEAYMMMAILYEHGRVGKPKSQGQSLRLLKQAADLGLPKAQFHLGAYYSAKDGGDIQENDKIAKQWLHCALDQGYGDAGYELGIIYDEPGQYQKALSALKQGAQYGSGLALSSLKGALQFNKNVNLKSDKFRRLRDNQLWRVVMDALQQDALKSQAKARTFTE